MLRFRLAAFARAFVSQCFKGSFVIIILHVQLSKTRVQSLLYHATPFLPHPISHPSPPLAYPQVLPTWLAILLQTQLLQGVGLECCPV